MVLTYVIKLPFLEVPPTSVPPVTKDSLDKYFFGHFLQTLIFEITRQIAKTTNGLWHPQRENLQGLLSGIWAFRLFSVGIFLSGERLLEACNFGSVALSCEQAAVVL